MIGIYYFFYRKIETIKEFFKCTIPNSVQRMYKGYGRCDTWSFDHYLCKIIPNALTDLKDRKIGYPVGITEEEWNTILTKIINTFNTAKKIIEFDYIYIPSYNDKFEDEHKRQYEWSSKHSIHVMTVEEAKVYEEGWSLFQKWFFNLWD